MYPCGCSKPLKCVQPNFLIPTVFSFQTHQPTLMWDTCLPEAVRAMSSQCKDLETLLLASNTEVILTRFFFVFKGFLGEQRSAKKRKRFYSDSFSFHVRHHNISVQHPAWPGDERTRGCLHHQKAVALSSPGCRTPVGACGRFPNVENCLYWLVHMASQFMHSCPNSIKQSSGLIFSKRHQSLTLQKLVPCHYYRLINRRIHIVRIKLAT